MTGRMGGLRRYLAVGRGEGADLGPLRLCGSFRALLYRLLGGNRLGICQQPAAGNQDTARADSQDDPPREGRRDRSVQSGPSLPGYFQHPEIFAGRWPNTPRISQTRGLVGAAMGLLSRLHRITKRRVGGCRGVEVPDQLPPRPRTTRRQSTQNSG